MRRQLRLTVAATVSIVLLAMLVPMAVLVRDYALEDRIAQAALEVQATETVVSGADDGRGEVSAYLGADQRRRRHDHDGVLPRHRDRSRHGGRRPGRRGPAYRAGPDRRHRRRRRADPGPGVAGPVERGGDPGDPGRRRRTGAGVRRAAGLPGAGGARTGAAARGDRARRAARTQLHRPDPGARLLDPGAGGRQRPGPVAVGGPPEVQELGAALNRLVSRIEELLEREREGVADLSHRLRTPVTALRLRIDQVDTPADRARLSADLEALEQAVDMVVRDARRSQREGIVAESDVAAVLAERAAFWTPLAEDQGRRLDVDLPAEPLLVAADEEDLAAALDVLLDNVFSYTPEGAAIRVRVAGVEPPGGALLVVEDAGSGFPEGLDVSGRGTSGSGSTGLGLSIVDRTAVASGGGVDLGTSDLGGARVAVRLGPPR